MAENKKSIPRLLVMLSLLMLVSAPLASFAGGGHQHGAGGTHVVDSFNSESTGNRVDLSADAISNLDIKTVKLGSKSIEKSISIFGRVMPHPKKITSVSASFDGRVEELFVIPGDYVEVGKRLVQVAPLQVGSKSVILRSEAQGYVTKLFVNSGQAFSRLDSLVEITNLEKVFIKGEVFQSEKIGELKVGQTCKADFNSFPQKVFTGKLEKLNPGFEEEAPLIHVYCIFANAKSLLKPNMRGNLEIISGKLAKTVVAPKNAILGEFGNYFTYIKKNNSFYKRPIVKGFETSREVQITQGLNAGDELVTRGHYQLQFASHSAEKEEGKSSSKASSSGHDHSHGSSHHGHEDQHQGHSHSGQDHHAH